MVSANYPLRISYFVAEPTRFAGSQKSLLILVKNLPRQHIDAEVVFLGSGKCEEIYRAAGVTTKILPVSRPQNSGQEAIRASGLKKIYMFCRDVLPCVWSIKKYFRERKAHIAHFNTPRALVFGYLAAKMAGLPVVFHVRGEIDALGILLKYCCWLAADHIIFVSNSIRKKAPAFVQRKSTVIYNGYDPEELDLAGVATTEQKKRTVICTSSLVPFKGYHHLIPAIALINKECPDVSFIGIGEKPDTAYEKYITDLCTSFQVKNFTHLGWQKNPHTFLRDAAISILPSVDEDILHLGGKPLHITGTEGLPRSVYEGMLAGCAVVACDVAGVCELIQDGQTGFIVPPCDPQAIAQAIIRLLQDEGLRNQLAKAGSLWAREHLSPHFTVRKTLDVYQKILV